MLAFRVVSIKLPTNYTGKAFKGCDMRIGCNGKRIYFLLAISAKLDNEARSTREWLKVRLDYFALIAPRASTLIGSHSVSNTASIFVVN